MSVACNVKDVITEQQFKEIVDANLLSQKWYKSINHGKKSLVDFIAGISKDPESLLVDADEQTKAKFYDDIPKILVPQKYEDAIITNCRLLVCKIVNGFRFVNNETIEDAIAVGNMAVRNAIWYYNRLDIEFSTVAYKSVKRKLITFKDDLLKNKEFTFTDPSSETTDFTDLCVDTKVFSPLLPSSRTNKLRACGRQYAQFDDANRVYSIKHIINSACWSQADKELVYLFINNPKTWIDDFKSKNLNPSGKTYHSYSVRKRLENVIKRMRDVAESEGITIDNVVADFGTGET